MDGANPATSSLHYLSGGARLAPHLPDRRGATAPLSHNWWVSRKGIGAKILPHCRAIWSQPLITPEEGLVLPESHSLKASQAKGQLPLLESDFQACWIFVHDPCLKCAKDKGEPSHLLLLLPLKFPYKHYLAICLCLCNNLQILPQCSSWGLEF